MTEPLNRRDFLKTSATLAAAGTLLSSGVISLSSCVSHAALRPEHGVPVTEVLKSGARVMWVAAHPDDETMVGSILAYASLNCHCPMQFVVMTRGDGGECCLKEGCKPDLATVRAGEMRQAAELYQAELLQESYFNAPLPVSSFPKRHELAKMWTAYKDPVKLIGEAIRRFKPDVLFTFEPTHGFTGHPEHQLTSRFAIRAVAAAADPTAKLAGAAHKVRYSYYILNRYWPFALAFQTDPLPVSETFDATQPCVLGHSCRELQAEFSKAHRTQERDMNDIRTFSGLFTKVHLRRVDPFRLPPDPYEAV